MQEAVIRGVGSVQGCSETCYCQHSHTDCGRPVWRKVSPSNKEPCWAVGRLKVKLSSPLCRDGTVQFYFEKHYYYYLFLYWKKTRWVKEYKRQTDSHWCWIDGRHLLSILIMKVGKEMTSIYIYKSTCEVCLLHCSSFMGAAETTDRLSLSVATNHDVPLSLTKVQTWSFRKPNGPDRPHHWFIMELMCDEGVTSDRRCHSPEVLNTSKMWRYIKITILIPRQPATVGSLNLEHIGCVFSSCMCVILCNLPT